MMRFRIRIEKWCQIKHFMQHVTCNDGINEVKGMKRSKHIRKVVK